MPKTKCNPKSVKALQASEFTVARAAENDAIEPYDGWMFSDESAAEPFDWYVNVYARRWEEAARPASAQS